MYYLIRFFKYFFSEVQRRRRSSIVILCDGVVPSRVLLQCWGKVDFTTKNRQLERKNVVRTSAEG